MSFRPATDLFSRTTHLPADESAFNLNIYIILFLYSHQNMRLSSNLLALQPSMIFML